jgi:uncharacterized alpha-E superfamily protein
MLSRAANAVYWLNRYVERAESLARFADVNLHMTTDLPAGVGEQWMPLIAVTAATGPFNERYDGPSRENVIRFLTFDRDNPSSIISCLSEARENARSVREIISSDMWEQINRLYLSVTEAASGGAPMDLFEFLAEVRRGCRLFEGIAHSTMSHGEAWHFMRLGRMLERADETTRILDVKYFILLPSVHDIGTAIDDIQWTAVLKSVSGFEMYRKKHGRITPTDIVQFLLLDREFPRAVHYCILTAVRSLHFITGSPPGTFCNLAERLLGQLEAELNYTQVSEVIASGLHEFLDGLQRKLNDADSAVVDAFFSLRPLEAGQGQTQ